MKMIGNHVSRRQSWVLKSCQRKHTNYKNLMKSPRNYKKELDITKRDMQTYE